MKAQEVFDAEIMLVGDSPDISEMLYKLNYWWSRVGIKKENVYVASVLNELSQQFHGDLTIACKRNPGLAVKIQEQEYSRLRCLGNELPELKVIVCAGEYATNCFTRYGSTVWSGDSKGVASVRGSVYEWHCTNGRTLRVIPMLAPAIINTQPEMERRIITDWERAARVIRDGWARPERNHIINPQIGEIEECQVTIKYTDVISFDIETWGDEIKCIGFATSPHESITVPTVMPAWQRIEGKQSRATASLQKAWELVRSILSGPHDKVAQNGLFDCWWLAQYDIDVQGYHWDTLAMHHAIVPNESHALDFLASIYTDEPYWKDEAKDADSISRIAKQGMDKLYVYNGLDVTVTWEIFSKLYDILDEQGRLPFYLRHYADMVPSILGLMRRGAPVDRSLIDVLRKQYLDTALRLRDEACLEAGRPLFKFESTALEKEMIADYYVNGPVAGLLGHDEDTWLMHFKQMTKTLKSGQVKPLWSHKTVDDKWRDLQSKGISDTELIKLLFNEWKCPRGKTTDSGKVKVDSISLKTLRNTVEGRKRGDFLEHKDAILRTIDLTLDHRRQRKLATFVDPSRIDSDDRIRCTYKFTTKTGRLASAANPRGTGTNLQNQDRAIRPIFVASPGRVLLECDLSQAEGRVVRALSGDPEAIRLASRLPTEGDEHTENAIKIFSHFYGREVTPDEIKESKKKGTDLRQIGKKVVHAGNYDQGKFGLSDTLLKDGFTMTPYECGKLIEAHREQNPYVDKYQAAVRRRMMKEHTLYTSWGRQISFEDIRIDENSYKFGYSYVPQSEIGDLLNQKGLKPLDNYLRNSGSASVIILQVHDSVVLDAVPEEVYSIIEFLKRSLETSRTYGGCFGHAVELTIPVEFKLGLNWAGGKEWKYLPEKAEVEDYLKELLTGRNSSWSGHSF